MLIKPEFLFVLTLILDVRPNWMTNHVRLLFRLVLQTLKKNNLDTPFFEEHVELPEIEMSRILESSTDSNTKTSSFTYHKEKKYPFFSYKVTSFVSKKK